MAWQREVSFWKRYVAAVAATVITHLIIWLSRIERAILPAATELLFDKDDARSLRGVTAFHQNQHLVWQGLPSFNLAR
ncbi:hypothetical protein N836_34375 [Leptolyngbya sp. Heron Island J]|uniref:hypothetical protein n=1 Tax=Leptolyngbya sp. Heron Island J TaxID=1385935 RepID=UPI0003B9D407|nr:hypothetical protein [Leptolyngbya sp. Heron Island J]ESA37993.1 hypothetical protein N836_34375 [Leptolyngbya sp. Heron Island J]